MMPVEKMKYGLVEFDSEDKQSFLYLIKSPFISVRRIKTEPKKQTKPE